MNLREDFANQDWSEEISSLKFSCKIMVQKDMTDLAESIVDLLEIRLRSRLSQLQPKPLGLATGRTMKPIYTALVTRLKSWPKNELENLLAGWCSFNLDEYVGLLDGSTDSFASYMARYLGGPLQLTSDQLRVPDGGSEDPFLEASSYVEQLKGLGGLGIQLLGLRTNGHVGFNEPPCGDDVSCRVVSLSEATRQQNSFAFSDDPKLVPSNAITLGIAEIMSAEEIHLIVTGEAKANILDSLLNEPPSERLPASWLGQHKNFYLWSDFSALSKAIPKMARFNDPNH